LLSNQLLAQSETIPTKSSFERPYFHELKKGNKMLSLNGWGNYSNGIALKSHSWTLNPQLGFSLYNRFLVGLQVAYGQQNFKQKNSNSITLPSIISHSLAPELYGRYCFTYFRINPFVQLSTGYNFQWEKQNKSTGENVLLNSSNYVGNGAAGISFNVGKNISIEALYIHRFFTKSALDDANKSINFRLGISFFIQKKTL
jgi:hypothetical protein